MISSKLLPILFSITLSSFLFADDVCQEADFSKSLYAICKAYISGESCLDQENSNSARCLALHKNFAKVSNGEDLNDLLGSNNGDTSTKTTIDIGGGSIVLPNIALVDFPEGAFDEPTVVTLYTTEDQAFVEAFAEFTIMHRVATRLEYEVRIATGILPPVSDTVHVELQVPQSFIDRVPDSYGIELFAMVEQGSDDEIPFPIIELFPSSYDATSFILSADLPTALFSINSLTGDEYEAILTIAATPGGDNITPSPTLTFSEKLMSLDTTSASTSDCKAASIGCPVKNGCTVRSAFQEARKHPVTGDVRGHYGVDYVAAEGDSIVAAVDGKVERAYDSSSFGKTIIIRHKDGSATLYAHLKSIGVANNEEVKKGQEIGLADSTGLSSGHHLHLEYVPNGQIIESKSRIDPEPCVNSTGTGSITVSDNGPIADDAFRLSLDGLVIGETTIGATNNINISNIIPGIHTLTLYVTIAPDNAGTYLVQLNDGLIFTTGETSMSGSAPQDATIVWQIEVPDPDIPGPL